MVMYCIFKLYGVIQTTRKRCFSGKRWTRLRCGKKIGDYIGIKLFLKFFLGWITRAKLFHLLCTKKSNTSIEIPGSNVSLVHNTWRHFGKFEKQWKTWTPRVLFIYLPISLISVNAKVDFPEWSWEKETTRFFIGVSQWRYLSPVDLGIKLSVKLLTFLNFSLNSSSSSLSPPRILTEIYLQIKNPASSF